MTVQEKLRILCVGGGSRGRAYTRSLRHLDWVRVCGIAEPNTSRREKLKKICSEFPGGEAEVSSIKEYTDWKESLADADQYDGVMICVLDDMHRDVAVEYADLGKHLLCEKPLATTWQDCQDIVAAVQRNNVLLAIGHVLRYSPHNLELKKLVDSGVIGDVINMNHTEPVGWYHFAHSYVRGNWRQAGMSTFSLMAKCCHDLDVLMWFLGSENITQVSSFGSLTYFKRQNKPQLAGDATRCMSCPAEPECAYSAKKIYYDDFVDPSKHAWKTKTLTDIEDEPHLREALEKGQYGRCVFECDNDVCDNQVVALNFGGKATATMTMVATSEEVCFRKMSLYGTKGEINTDSRTIRIFDFNSQKTTTVTPPMESESGHGGGDKGLATAFATALRDVLWKDANVKDATAEHIKCTPEDVLASHKIVFLAEQARLSSSVCSINDKITL